MATGESAVSATFGPADVEAVEAMARSPPAALAATPVAMASVKDRAAKPGWVDAIELTFAVAFVLELGLKIVIEGYTFFCGPHWKWNLFDLVLGVSPLLDVLFIAARTARSI